MVSMTIKMFDIQLVDTVPPPVSQPNHCSTLFDSVNCTLYCVISCKLKSSAADQVISSLYYCTESSSFGRVTAAIRSV